MHADARKLLWDARRAAEQVVRFTQGKTFADYLADDLLRSGVERQLAIVGEAFNQLRQIDPGTAGAIPPTFPVSLGSAMSSFTFTPQWTTGSSGASSKPTSVLWWPRLMR
jgi:hypothetical protein